MNQRTKVLIGLLCIGFVTAQNQFRPQVLSQGRGFESNQANQNFINNNPGVGKLGGVKSASVVKTGAPRAGNQGVIPHDQKKQTTFWWVAPDSPFKATKIGGGLQEPPVGDDGAAGESNSQSQLSSASQASSSQASSKSTGSDNSGAAGSGTVASFESASSSQTSNSRNGNANNAPNNFGESTSAFEASSSQTSASQNGNANNAPNNFGGTTSSIAASRSQTSTSQNGNANNAPNNFDGTTSTFEASRSQTITSQNGNANNAPNNFDGTTSTFEASRSQTSTLQNTNTNNAPNNPNPNTNTGGISSSSTFSATKTVTGVGNANQSPPNLAGANTNTFSQTNVNQNTFNQNSPPATYDANGNEATYSFSKQTVTKTVASNGNNNVNTALTATQTNNNFANTNNNNNAFPATGVDNSASTFSANSRTSTSTTGTNFAGNDQATSSANNVNLQTYSGTAVTKTQERTGTGYTSNTITTGVIAQPFIKKTTVTSDGYNYPVPQTIPCYEPNKVCASNQFCQNGFVNENQLGLFDSNNQNCNAISETCCTVKPSPPQSTQCPDNNHVCVSPSLCNDNGFLNFDAQNAVATKQPTDRCYAPEICCQQPSLISESTVLTNEGYVVKVPSNQYLPIPESQNENAVYISTTKYTPPPTTTTPRPTTTRYVPPPTTTRYIPPTTTRYVPAETTTRYVQQPPSTKGPFQGEPYIPPSDKDTSSSNTDINKIRPPTTRRPQDEIPLPDNNKPVVIRPTQPPGPAPLPPVGCPAAMNCTEAQFCSAMGVISKTPVILTPEQQLFRVPTTDCRSPDKGFVGVCCRDPDYVDPWPVGQLGLYNPDLSGFDNGQYRPDTNNKVSRNTAPARGDQILGSQSRVTSAQTAGPNQLFKQQSTIQQKTVIQNTYDRGVTVPQSSGAKRFTASGLQFSQSGNTKFKPFTKPSGVCAPRNFNTQPRGAGQFDTGFGEFPWQAMVLLDTNRSLLCGGAIIADNIVVTAANCVYGLNPRDVLIKGGEWRLGVDEEPKSFQIAKVKSIIYHPAYQPTTLNYDVAILNLEDRLRFDMHIGPICLDDNDLIPSASYDNCVTTGWGKEVLRIHIKNALMHYMPISLVSEQESQQSLAANGFYPESHICGRPKADACEVDIGSALACADATGAYYLKGIYSSETECNRPDQIVSFSNIDVQWIRQALKNPNQFITPLPQYQPAANSPVATTVNRPSTLGPSSYGPQYLPPYK